MEEEDYEYGYDCGQDEEEEVEDEEKLDYLADIVMDLPINFRRLKSQSSMIFIKFDDIKRVLDKKIEELEELLGLTYDEALIVFHHFGWNRDKLENSDWFTNQEKISRKAGLLPIDDNLPAEAAHECPVCLFECPPEDLDGLKCGHKICKMCWSSFINEKVNLKENEFFWRCPGNTNGKNCNLIVPNAFNRKYLKGENEAKYMRKLCISYVEENKAIRYCPAPDCMYCIENPSLTSRTIQCRCSNVFCFRCGREDHYPCNCEIAGNWQSKNIQESENTKWVDVYTKKCPKCRNPIEKNLGCNHMTCKHSGCNFEFCWLCLDDWKTHQGSHYKCNKFESLNEEEKSSAIGINAKEKASLEKYVFYFERFCNNERAYQIAKKLHNKMEQNVAELHQKLNLAREELYFLTEAADTLQKIRKILKWTYAYAYYITDNKIKNLFEFNQKDLEKYCEELSEALELHYPKSIQVNQGVLDLKIFQCFKDKVTTLNSKCLKFSTDLSKDIEDDFIKFL